MKSPLFWLNMTELSLNVLDVAENSVRAGASLISITVAADTNMDRLTITIEDNGCGMKEEELRRVTDPFFTSRTTRKVGLGFLFLNTPQNVPAAASASLQKKVMEPR